LKSDFVKNINPAGETPTVVYPDGKTVVESEIVVEFLD